MFGRDFHGIANTERSFSVSTMSESGSMFQILTLYTKTRHIFEILTFVNYELNQTIGPVLILSRYFALIYEIFEIEM